MSNGALLTASDLLAAASSTLKEAGYAPIGEDPSHANGGMRAFEDPYGIVGIRVFETWQELSNDWPNAQGELVELISDHISRSDAKAWEGYLVLLTPSSPPLGASKEIDDVRYNVSRVRKLVATAPALETVADVERILLPLLPLRETPIEADQASPIELVGGLLEDEGFRPEVVRALLSAFISQESLMEAVHRGRSHE